MQRRALLLARIGCVLVVIAMAVAALVLLDKPHFGWMVNRIFVPAIASGVILGGVLVVIAALLWPDKRSWRRWLLLAWGLIAATSPLFGFLFLMPWAVLVVMLPGVGVVLAKSR